MVWSATSGAFAVPCGSAIYLRPLLSPKLEPLNPDPNPPADLPAKALISRLLEAATPLRVAGRRLPPNAEPERPDKMPPRFDAATARRLTFGFARLPAASFLLVGIS